MGFTIFSNRFLDILAEESILSLTVLDIPTSDDITTLLVSNPFTSQICISEKIHTQKSILQTACKELHVIREHENINTQEND